MPIGVYPRKPRFCTVPDCGGKHEGNGLCAKHWHRVWKANNPERVRDTKARYWLRKKEKAMFVRRRSLGLKQPIMLKYFRQFITGKPHEQS